MNTTLAVPPDFRADANADADAVAAIRLGDRERYRELVERYGEKVFAVAWCRLGDRDLAEEASQETFIKGYRRLALLDEAERFGSWITAIARNAAINLGVRRRSELRKRERWALEIPEPEESPAPVDKSEKPVSETLRETLAALPAIHRECLVLFYLESKSVSEAALVLGLSETAFKTRLHRARAALREQMETRLEETLGSLRPSPAMTSLIMLALPLGKPVWSLGGAVAVAISKASTLGGFTFLLQLLQAGPAVVFSYWMSKKEVENLRDQGGIRARNIVRIRNGMIALVIFSIIGIAIIHRALDLQRTCQVFAVITLAYCAAGARQLRFSRHRNVLANWLGTALLGLALLGVGFLDWNIAMLAVMQGFFFIFMSLMLDAQPLRPDLSPFVAAQAGKLPADPECAESPTPRDEHGVPVPASAEERFEFGKFLGARMIALDWRQAVDSLRLRLAPVTPSNCLGSLPIFWGDASTLTLHSSGAVETHLGARDRAALVALSPGHTVESESLEAAVTRAAVKALHHVRAEQTAEAERYLGAEPASTLYHVEPKKTVLARTRKWGLRVVGLMMIAEGIWIYQMQRSLPPGTQLPPRPIALPMAARSITPAPPSKAAPPVKTAPAMQPD